MGLGKLLTRAIEYQVTNTETGYSELFTVNGSPPLAPDWATDDYRGGMGIPGAWRATTLISDLLGQVPWNAHRKIGDRPPEKLSRTPILLEQPSPPETRMTTISSLALDLIWHGNAGGPVAARDAAGYPTAIYPVPAQYIQVRRVTPGVYSSLPIGEVEYSIGGLTLPHWDVLHVKGPCAPGALRGMGVLEAHLETLKLAHEQRRQAAGLAHHGVPSGIIKASTPDLTKTEADDLKAAWMTAQQTRRPMVLNATTDFTPVSWNPEEMQLVEARRMTLQELALVFGLPPYWLGVEAGSMTYSSTEMQWLDILRTTLGGHLARFEQALSQFFPRGTWVEADVDAFLRSDTLTRYQAHALGINSGFLTVDEAREIEGRQPLPQTTDTTIDEQEDGDDDE